MSAKKAIGIAALLATGVLFSGGCTSKLYSAYNTDDLYGVHDRAAIARAEARRAEIEKAEAEARQAKYEALLAEADADATEQRYRSSQDILADNYESAYARRLRGFESPTYRMPSSYWDLYTNGSYVYLSAYDPAFYNVMVMGDQVWVEPKYITSMFGSWGPTVNFSFGWRNPWSWWYDSWYSPWSSPWYGFGGWWGSPWWWDWHYGPHYPWYPSFGGGWWPGHHNHRPNNVVYGPSYNRPLGGGTVSSGSGGGYNRPSGTTNGYRPGSGTRPGGGYTITRPSRGGSTSGGYTRPGTSSGEQQSTRPSYRSPSSRPSRNETPSTPRQPSYQPSYQPSGGSSGSSGGGYRGGSGGGGGSTRGR